MDCIAAIIADARHDKFAHFAAFLSAGVSIAITNVGWLLCNYLAVSDKLDKAHQQVLDTTLTDVVLYKLYFITALVPAFCIGKCVFIGMFAAKHILPEADDNFWDSPVAYSTSRLLLVASSIALGLYAGLTHSVMGCQYVASDITLEAVAQTLQWWMAPFVEACDMRTFGFLAGAIVLIIAGVSMLVRFIIEQVTGMSLAEFLDPHGHADMSDEACLHCGNIYAADAIFCRKCGHGRHQPPPTPVLRSPVFSPVLPTINTTTCLNCRNVYAEDALFCRKCGTQRVAAAPSPAMSALNRHFSPTMSVLAPSPAMSVLQSPRLSELGGARRRASTPPPAGLRSPQFSAAGF